MKRLNKLLGKSEPASHDLIASIFPAIIELDAIANLEVGSRRSTTPATR